MKSRIVDYNHPDVWFKPFEVYLIPETVKEARLLFHIFNHLRLGDLIKSDLHYFDGFSKDIATFVSSIDVERKIQDAIKGQGFKL